MRNPKRYQLYIITEGICLNYKGVPLLFTEKQIYGIIASLCFEYVVPTARFYIPKNNLPIKPTFSYWFNHFIDTTHNSGVSGPFVPAKSTALKDLNIPLRLYTREEFYIEPTRKSHKQYINKFNHAYKCVYCRYNTERHRFCYCQSRGSDHFQNDYYDFRSIIINTLC